MSWLWFFSRKRRRRLLDRAIRDLTLHYLRQPVSDPKDADVIEALYFLRDKLSD